VAANESVWRSMLLIFVEVLILVSEKQDGIKIRFGVEYLMQVKKSFADSTLLRHPLALFHLLSFPRTLQCFFIGIPIPLMTKKKLTRSEYLGYFGMLIGIPGRGRVRAVMRLDLARCSCRRIQMKTKQFSDERNPI